MEAENLLRPGLEDGRVSLLLYSIVEALKEPAQIPRNETKTLFLLGSGVKEFVTIFNHRVTTLIANDSSQGISNNYTGIAVEVVD